MFVWLAYHAYIYVFAHFYMIDQSKLGSKPISSSNCASTTKSGSTRSSLTLPSFKESSELLTSRIEGEILASPKLKAFSLSDLKAETKNFCPNSLIGEGSFGYVYKGWIDEQTLGPSSQDILWLL
jgi:hypothetical protein